jgi:hypothetical protein
MRNRADQAIKAVVTLSVSSLGVTFNRGELCGPAALSAPNAPHRGGRKQRQATDRRIGQENNPDRHRHRRHHRNRNDPYRCRQQNQSCNHREHFPRETHWQDAPDTRQDCGWVWVNLRQRTIRRSPIQAMSERERVACRIFGFRRPAGDKHRTARAPRLSAEYQGQQVKFDLSGVSGFHLGMAQGGLPRYVSLDRRLAKSRRIAHFAIRRFCKPCHSFVMPQQQGGLMIALGVIN